MRYKKRCEDKRFLFRAALQRLVEYREQVIFVDETAKDRNLAHRRKAWGEHGENRTVRQWV